MQDITCIGTWRLQNKRNLLGNGHKSFFVTISYVDKYKRVKGFEMKAGDRLSLFVSVQSPSTAQVEVPLALYRNSSTGCCLTAVLAN